MHFLLIRGVRELTFEVGLFYEFLTQDLKKSESSFTKTLFGGSRLCVSQINVVKTASLIRSA